jgi:hypothetical protein
MLAELDQTGESQISLTDPDSRAMTAHTHVAPPLHNRQPVPLMIEQRDAALVT